MRARCDAQSLYSILSSWSHLENGYGTLPIMAYDGRNSEVPQCVCTHRLFKKKLLLTLLACVRCGFASARTCVLHVSVWTTLGVFRQLLQLSVAASRCRETLVHHCRVLWLCKITVARLGSPS